jgi:hypothetical protein
MAYSTVSEQGWFSRIGDSIKGILVGGVLFLVAFPVLFWNEGRAVHRSQDLAEGQGAVRSVESTAPNAANDGKLVLFNGTATSDGSLKDDDFSISVPNAIHLSRTAEMYQWKENKQEKKEKSLGGSERTVTTYTYSRDWSDKLIDSDQFNHDSGNSDSKGKVNPHAMSLKDGAVVTSKDWTADKVTVGGFTVPRELVASINKSEVVPAAVLAEGKLGGLKTADDKYYTGDPASPQIGDVRIGFRAVKPQPVTALGKQQGATIIAYTTKGGRPLMELRTGQMDAQAFFTQLAAENNMLTWILRLVGFLAMAIGIALFLRPFRVMADVVPFIGDIAGAGIVLVAVVAAAALSLFTIALGWIVYRPLLGIALLVVSAALFFALAKMRKARIPARPAAAVA